MKRSQYHLRERVAGAKGLRYYKPPAYAGGSDKGLARIIHEDGPAALAKRRPQSGLLKIAHRLIGGKRFANQIQSPHSGRLKFDKVKMMSAFRFTD